MSKLFYYGSKWTPVPVVDGRLRFNDGSHVRSSYLGIPNFTRQLVAPRSKLDGTPSRFQVVCFALVAPFLRIITEKRTSGSGSAIGGAVDKGWQFEAYSRSVGTLALRMSRAFVELRAQECSPASSSFNIFFFSPFSFYIPLLWPRPHPCFISSPVPRLGLINVADLLATFVSLSSYRCFRYWNASHCSPPLVISGEPLEWTLETLELIERVLR